MISIGALLVYLLNLQLNFANFLLDNFSVSLNCLLVIDGLEFSLLSVLELILFHCELLGESLCLRIALGLLLVVHREVALLLLNLLHNLLLLLLDLFVLSSASLSSSCFTASCLVRVS